MRLLYDFKCQKCGGIFEKFTNSTFMLCDCGGTMDRMISTPTVKLEGISGAFPGAADKWAKIREEKHRIDSRRNS